MTLTLKEGSAYESKSDVEAIIAVFHKEIEEICQSNVDREEGADIDSKEGVARHQEFKGD